jgi:hypothetical protein
MQRNHFGKKCLAVGISIIAVVLLVLGSLSNVVGYQTVQSSNQNVIKERINPKELLLKTVNDFSQKITLWRDQNVSLRYIVFYMLGFVYGLITLIPGAIILLIYVIIAELFIISILIHSGDPNLINHIFLVIFWGIIIWVMGMLTYPFTCGEIFAERFTNYADNLLRGFRTNLLG